MSSKPIILGINTVYHETSACILRGAEVLAFAEQERLNRVKHGKEAMVDNPDELPVDAILYCLDRAGVRWSEIDHVAVSFDPSLRDAPSDEPTSPGGWGTPEGEATFREHLLKLPSLVSEVACLDLEDRWLWIPHERAHAASAYFASPFQDAAVLSVDGIGEASTALLAHGRGTELHELDVVLYPHSLGFVWETLSTFLGFGEYHAGKVMALASFGRAPELAREFGQLVIRRNGSFEVAIDELLFRAAKFGPLEKRFGARRQPGDLLEPRHAALAAALQHSTEEILLDFARRLQHETGSENLCLAGGVMLNCVALGRLLAEAPFSNVFVQPVAHDAGTALGAALATLYAETGCTDRWVMESPYLGPEYSESEMQEALQAAELSSRRSPDVAREAAQAIADGEIVGWFQGAAEAGPRALGNRSILADPRRATSKDLINLKAKHREFFRPFAPAVLAEEVSAWFEIPRDSASLRFMSFALPVRREQRQRVPAIVHVNGTGRPQLVEHWLNPAFHALLSAFRAITEVPLVLNTSFNTHDEPIVCSPTDAVRTFVRTDLDRLFMGSFVVESPRRASRGGAC